MYEIPEHDHRLMLDFARAHRTAAFTSDGEAVCIGNANELNAADRNTLRAFINQLRPWRKGPFHLFGERIDANWQSDIKWNRVRQFMDSLRGARVCDIGCNNGYFLFRMLEHAPTAVIGLDPVPGFRQTFDFLHAFYPDERLTYINEGWEWLRTESGRQSAEFDVIFCMGILYHHTDPIDILRTLHAALKTGGQLIVEGMGISDDAAVDRMAAAADPAAYVYVPEGRYAGARGIWMVPTAEAMRRWLHRSGFRHIEFHGAYAYGREQRRTEQGDLPSTGDFLNADGRYTVDGQPAPWRHYFSARR